LQFLFIQCNSFSFIAIFFSFIAIFFHSLQFFFVHCNSFSFIAILFHSFIAIAVVYILRMKQAHQSGYSFSLLYLKIGYRLSLKTILGFLTGGGGQDPKYQLHLVVSLFFWQFRTSGFVLLCSD